VAHWNVRIGVPGALALSGLVCAMTVPAATDWPVFRTFLREVVIPALRPHKPGATLVMDHLAAHRLRQTRALSESAGFALLPLPRYGCELSPIEHCWSKLKTPLRTAEQPRSLAVIEEQIAPALDIITPEDAQGWFRHCGYAVSS
jgi:hypothetical protein